MLKLRKFPPPYWGGFTFYYTSHDMNRFIPHVHRARPLNGFENGPNLAENRKKYVLLTTRYGNCIFFIIELGSAIIFSANRSARFAKVTVKWVYGMEFP